MKNYLNDQVCVRISFCHTNIKNNYESFSNLNKFISVKCNSISLYVLIKFKGPI